MTSIIQTLNYLNGRGDCSVKLLNSFAAFGAYKLLMFHYHGCMCSSMGFIYPNKFTYLKTLVIQLALRCSDNEGPTVHKTFYGYNVATVCMVILYVQGVTRDIVDVVKSCVQCMLCRLVR